MRTLKQSTAFNVMVLMVDSTDHVTGKTGLTLTITASKAGAAFSGISPTVTERGNGWYAIELTTAHTDTLGDLALHVTGVNADAADTLSQVVAGSLDADISTRATAAALQVVDDFVDEIEGRLTAGRATNLDNLDVTVGSRLATAGYTAPDNLTIADIRRLLANKRVLDTATGIETLYDDAGVALYTRQVYEDGAGAQTYRGQGADRVERYA